MRKGFKVLEPRLLLLAAIFIGIVLGVNRPLKQHEGK